MELTNKEILKIVELYKDAISGYDFKSMERSSTGECHSCYKIHVSAQKKLQKIGFNFYQHYAFTNLPFTSFSLRDIIIPYLSSTYLSTSLIAHFSISITVFSCFEDSIKFCFVIVWIKHIV